MARASKQTVEHEVVVLEQRQAVVLEMDDDEALFLADVLMRVGGAAGKTRRKYQDALSTALEKAGVRGGGAQDIEGGIRMLNTPRSDRTSREIYSGFSN